MEQQEAQEKSQMEENAAGVENNAQAENNEPVDPVEELTVKCQKLHDEYMRLYADFDNYRKRTMKEKSELIKTASEGVLVDVIFVRLHFIKEELFNQEVMNLSLMKQRE